jgi:peptidoglycan/LPS O-acetylase OafA/YrhL
VHQIVLRVLAKETGTGHHVLTGTALALGALAIAVIGSWLLYRCVELPGMALIGGRRRPRHRAEPALPNRSR